jgi:hypothetical protein
LCVCPAEEECRTDLRRIAGQPIIRCCLNCIKCPIRSGRPRLFAIGPKPLIRNRANRRQQNHPNGFVQNTKGHDVAIATRSSPCWVRGPPNRPGGNRTATERIRNSQIVSAFVRMGLLSCASHSAARQYPCSVRVLGLAHIIQGRCPVPIIRQC